MIKIRPNKPSNSRNDVFQRILHKIFNIRGKCDQYDGQLMFDYEMGFLLFNLKIDIKYKPDLLDGRYRNVLFHFINQYRLPGTPSEKELDLYLTELGGNIQKWVQNRWINISSKKSFLNMIVEWVFFKLMRELFRFPIYKEGDDQIKPILDGYSKASGDYRFELLLEALIGQKNLSIISEKLRDEFKTSLKNRFNS